MEISGYKFANTVQIAIHLTILNRNEQSVHMRMNQNGHDVSERIWTNIFKIFWICTLPPQANNTTKAFYWAIGEPVFHSSDKGATILQRAASIQMLEALHQICTVVFSRLSTLWRSSTDLSLKLSNFHPKQTWSLGLWMPKQKQVSRESSWKYIKGLRSGVSIYCTLVGPSRMMDPDFVHIYDFLLWFLDSWLHYCTNRPNSRTIVHSSAHGWKDDFEVQETDTLVLSCRYACPSYRVTILTRQQIAWQRQMCTAKTH